VTLSLVKRCAWSETDPLLLNYHDEEWGVPVRDDRKLFEFLSLEGAQAGLSWLTILRKRENYRKAFDNFDPIKVAKYNQRKLEALLRDAGIVRNRAKIIATVENAKRFAKVSKDYGSFQSYLSGFVDQGSRRAGFKDLQQLPSSTQESEKLSNDLRKRGFSFVGPTVCYAFMQAVGLVNDHVTGCFRYREIEKMRLH
jgi:DNA-3-methyladenine glycosylase I